jgi:hypothetical protein
MADATHCKDCGQRLPCRGCIERDAERYRWLRDKSIGHRDPAPTSTMLDGYGIKVAYQMHHVDPRVAPTGFLSGDYLDALLDKLIAESAAREAARGVSGTHSETFSPPHAHDRKP